MLEKFTRFAIKSTGKMSLYHFCNYLGLPPTSAVFHVFNMYDRVSVCVCVCVDMESSSNNSSN